MSIQQLEYIIAVEKFRHFARASESCFVTQPTLSMMIQKLEEELGVKIFDRSKHPVEPTPLGERVIARSRLALKQFRQIREEVDAEQDVLSGSFRLGVIPTIAGYLVPELLRRRSELGAIDLTLSEGTTDRLIRDITLGVLDGGIMAGPLGDANVIEYPLYYEQFYAYVSPLDESYSDREIDLESIDLSKVWLLANEHCLRGQIERLCKLKERSSESDHACRYESGSLDTLIHVVDYNPGFTIIPELHAMGLSEDRQGNLRRFKNKSAVREVSLVVSSDYVRRAMLNAITSIIRSVIPRSMQDPALKSHVVDL